jgi:Helix-turn-helix domain
MGVVMAGYSIYLRPDLLQVFWAGMQAGDFITDAVAPINTSRRTGRRVLVEAGWVRPRRGRDLKGRCLTFAPREEIAVLRAQGRSLRAIGTVIGRSASTVSRELRRNTRAGSGYRATSAHALAYERASRPKPAKLHTNTGAACEGGRGPVSMASGFCPRAAS